MLKKEFSSFLKDTLGVDLEALKAAVTSDDEVEVKFKSGTFLDEESLNGLKETVKKEGYNEGKKTGVEMEAKRVKEKFGIEIEGKDFDKIFDAFGSQTLANAKIEPDKKVKELSTSLQNLQAKYETDLGLKEKELSQLSGTLENFKTDSKILMHVPKGLKGINPQQFATLVKTEFGFGYDDNSNFVAKKGEAIIKDKLEKPLPVNDVLESFARQNGWLDKDGRGDGDDLSGKSGFKNMSDVFKYMEQNNIDPYSDEGQKIQENFKLKNK